MPDMTATLSDRWSARLRLDLRRVLTAGAVAGGLGLAFWLVADAVTRSRFARLSCHLGRPGCTTFVGVIGLYAGLLAAFAGVLAIVVLAWPLLHAAGVRPAWPVALAGPVVAMAASGAYLRFVPAPHGAAVVPIVLAISYTAAAAITSTRGPG
jgi:hypothetical protein